MRPDRTPAGSRLIVGGHRSAGGNTRRRHQRPIPRGGNPNVSSGRTFTVNGFGLVRLRQDSSCLVECFVASQAKRSGYSDELSMHWVQESARWPPSVSVMLDSKGTSTHVRHHDAASNSTRERSRSKATEWRESENRLMGRRSARAMVVKCTCKVCSEAPGCDP